MPNGLRKASEAVVRAAAHHLPTVAQVLVLTTVAVALLWPAPVDSALLPAVFPGSDLLLSHWPSATLIKDAVAQNQGLPLWNPYYGGGRPLAADPLAALFYPATHLVHLLAIRDHFLVMMLGHLILAGSGMLLLARIGLGLSPVASLVTALAFMAAPRMIGHVGAGHLTLLQTVAWFPWAALLCRATVRDPARWFVPTTFCLALMFLAGHPQMVYYAALMLAPLSLWLLARRWREGGTRALVASSAGLAVAAACAGAIAGVHLLPAAEFTAYSTRQQIIGTTDQVPLRPFLEAIVGMRAPWEQHPRGVPHEVMFEPGLVVLALAVIGAIARPRVGVPLTFGIVVVGALAVANQSPLFHLALDFVPGFDRWFRAVARIWFVAMVAIGLLAGLGTEAVARSAVRLPRVGGAAGFACLALVIANLLMIDQGLARVGEVAAHTQPSELERAAAAAAGGGRVYGAQRNMSQLSAIDLGVELADGQDPLLIESYSNFMERAGGYAAEGYQLAIPAAPGEPDAGLLGLLDVRVVISRTPLADSRLIPVGEVEGSLIYLNPDAVGRAYFVGSPGSEAPSADHLSSTGIPAQELERGRERLAVEFAAPAGGLLVVGLPVFPGWIARLDGQPVTPAAIDGILPAVRVEPGFHRLTYTYEPASVRQGAALSLGGLSLTFAWFWASWARRRRSSRQ